MIEILPSRSSVRFNDGFAIERAAREPPFSIADLQAKLTAGDFKKVWAQALRNRQITWKRGDPLTKTVSDALSDTFVYAGTGMKISQAKEPSLPEVRDAMRYITGNRKEFPASALSVRSLKALLLQKDPQVLKAIFEELKHILSECAGKLPAVGSREEALFQAFVGNIIAILPYSSPRVGESLIIPQKIDGVWKNCTYTIDRRFDMSPNWLLTPLAAYGLKSAEGPPLVVFSGTTFGDGCTASFVADFTPGMSVGHIADLWGHPEVVEWIGDQKARLYGVSLGGAICMHFLRKSRNLVSEVNAYNPALLYPWDWDKQPFDDVPINVYCQENDFVAKGLFPVGKRVSVYQVSGSDVHNCFKAHALVFTGLDHVLIMKSTPEYENSRPYRKFLTCAHLIATIVLGTIPFLSLGAIYLIYSSCKRVFGQKIMRMESSEVNQRVTGLLMRARL